MDRRQEGEGHHSDGELLAAFLAGDEVAFATLVGRYGPELYQFIARFVQNSAAAEDVVQETFAQVHQSAAGFDLARRFRPWLFTIAANKARDHLRSRARKREVSLNAGHHSAAQDEGVSYLDFLADDSLSPHEALEGEEQREAVRKIVSQMPDHLREILVLGYYQRFPYKEIAEVLAIPLGTVKSRLHAAVSHFAAAYRRETLRQTRADA
ncbi:MAG: sigma-70 family RNA polymerase sigma factor [Planctomycetota bacterium]|nr:sigma-70 family RNA polymerase sigma factor [Planctomycetota bacterium]